MGIFPNKQATPPQKPQEGNNAGKEIVFDYPEDSIARNAAITQKPLFDRLVAAIKRELALGADSPTCVHLVNVVASDYLERYYTKLEKTVAAYVERHAHFDRIREKFSAMFDKITALTKKATTATSGDDKDTHIEMRTFVKLAGASKHICDLAMNRDWLADNDAITMAAKLDRLCDTFAIWLGAFNKIYESIEMISRDEGSMSFFERSAVDLYIDMRESTADRHAVGQYYKELLEYVQAIEKGLNFVSTVQTQRDIMSEEYISRLREWIAVVDKEFEDTKKLEQKCKEAMLKKMSDDISAINERFDSVMPNVPKDINDGNVYYPYDDGNVLMRIPLEYMNRRPAVATVALSSIFAANSGNKNAKNLFSVSTFKKLGLVSEQTQTALIVDDGYVYPLSAIQFGVRKIFEIFDENVERLKRKAINPPTKESIHQMTAVQDVFFTQRAFGVLNALFNSAKR